MLDLISLSGVGEAAFLLTPAELHQVVKTKQEADWNHTAALLCMIHNLIARKGQQKTPTDFHPLAEKKRFAGSSGLARIKQLLVGGG